MSQMPIVFGNVDKNGSIQVSSDNFQVTRESKGVYQVSYDSALSFDYPPCVVATGVYPDSDTSTRACTIQGNTKDGFEIYFKSTGGNLYDCGFNMAVFYNVE